LLDHSPCIHLAYITYQFKLLVLYLVHVYREVDEEKGRDIFLRQPDHVPPFSASFTTAIGAIARHSAKDSVFFFLAMAESDQSMGASEFVNCNWLDILPEGVEWYTKNVGKLDKARLLSIAVNGPPSSGIPLVDGCSQFLHSFSRTVVSLQ
jgi:hypothetical protein